MSEFMTGLWGDGCPNCVAAGLRWEGVYGRLHAGEKWLVCRDCGHTWHTSGGPLEGRDETREGGERA